MINFNSKKNKRVLSSVIVVIIVLAMVIGVAAPLFT